MESKIERVKQEMASFFTTNPFLKSCNQFEWHTVKKSNLKKFIGNAKLVKAEEMGYVTVIKNLYKPVQNYTKV